MTRPRSHLSGALRNPTVLGSLALPALALLVLGSLAAGRWFLTEFGAKIVTDSPEWEMPYLVGWLLGAGSVAVGNKLSHTRLAEWYIHFETWFMTLGYRGDNS